MMIGKMKQELCNVIEMMYPNDRSYRLKMNKEIEQFHRAQACTDILWQSKRDKKQSGKYLISFSILMCTYKYFLYPFE